MNKKLRSMLALVLGVVMTTSFVACAGNPDGSSSSVPSISGSGGNSSSTGGNSSSSRSSSSSTTPGDNPGGEIPDDGNAKYTYKTYTSVSPSNWNELTYQDNNDTQIMNYLNSPLFEFDFKFDGEGEIIPGDFEVEYSFATALTDLSDGDGTKWAIQIRNDGKWDDGTPITAHDFVYTMQEQLNPLFMNYRADSFYNGATVVKNAEAYVKQGSSEFRGAHSGYATWEEAKVDPGVTFDIMGSNTYFGAWAKKSYSGYYDENTGWAWLTTGLGAATTEDAVFALQGKTYAEIEADADLKAAFDAVIAMWKTEPNEELHFFGYNYTWDAMNWEEVGFYASDDYTIVLDLAQPLYLLNDDGSLSYKAAYNMASLPLVKRSLYESCKVAPVAGSTLYTSKYHSSLETTASWGPYKLTSFQAGKWYTLEKNPYWYGWNMDKYEGQYQTTSIVCETIAEYNTAFMKFLKGELSGIGIDVSVATDYKNSDQAYFTPDDYVGSLQLQSSPEGLRNRESNGVNKTILLQEDFRKALSLGLNRDAYAKATTTASLMGLGLFNSMHYYDVANGKAYRESDIAKMVLCSVYGLDPDEFGSLDDAVDAITGYDIEQARELVNSAVAKAIEAGDLKADANGNVTDRVVLTYGTSVDNEVTRRYYDNLSAQWTELMKGTKLEGKFELEFNSSFGTKWADDFRAGAYDICQGGWTGAAWDPGYFLLAYLSPDYMYSAAWDTSAHMLEFTMSGVNAEGVATNNANDSYTAEHDLLTWYDLLNGEWQSGALDEEFRLELIAVLEHEILIQYYSVPVTYSFAASLISYQADYITYEYNTFMGYGGIRYMTYNYDDAEWADYVKANAVNGELNYR